MLSSMVIQVLKITVPNDFNTHIDNITIITLVSGARGEDDTEPLQLVLNIEVCLLNRKRC